MTDTQFWMVWSPDGGVPTARHVTRKDAEIEAHRLLKKTKGREFYVLEAVSVTRPAGSITQDLAPVKTQPESPLGRRALFGSAGVVSVEPGERVVIDGTAWVRDLYRPGSL